VLNFAPFGGLSVAFAVKSNIRVLALTDLPSENLSAKILKNLRHQRSNKLLLQSNEQQTRHSRFNKNRT
jgi:hypothetical protein